MTKEEYREKFNLELEKLSVRAKNILEDQGLLLFDFFYEQYFINKNRIDFRWCRNCGVKTKSELDQFVTEMYSVNEIEISVIKPFISRPQLLQNNPIIPLKTSFKTKLIFESEYDKLSVRTRNILSSIEADTIDGFYNNAFFKDAQSFFFIRNCGIESLKEILNFKLNFKDILDTNQKFKNEDSSFSDIEFYINHSNCFKSIELELFQYYYGFVICDRKETLTDIANRNNYSRERVRQISKLLLKRIREIVIILSKKYDLNFQKYFLNDCFIVDKNFANKINSSEHTSYSHKLIALVLTFVNNPDFVYLESPIEKITQNVLFIKDTVPFDSVRCFKYLTENIFSKKSHCIKIPLDDIIKSFSRMNPLGYNERMEIISIIKLQISLLNDEKDRIVLENNQIIFEQNSKRLLYELFWGILDEYKKPMHFLDLYQECLTRGYEIKSPTSVHSTLIRYNDVFGLKGPGIYGLLEWGGYFGTIGDVAATILEKRNLPISRCELEEILCRELYISKDSIPVILFGYDMETRFIKTKNDTISLKKWIK